MERASPSRLQRFVDVAIPFSVALFLVLLVGEDRREEPDLHLVGNLVAIAQGVALYWRRSHPEIVMAATLAGGGAMQYIAPDGMVPFAPMFAIFALAAVRPPRISVPALIALMGVAATNFISQNTEDSVFVLIMTVVPWALGEAARNRREAIEQGAQRAVTDEQARIARELHDVIAHSVSVIVVQAAAADDVFDERPDQARTALRSIEAAGRDAMRELRLLLAAVRPDERDDTHPQPGLDRLDELAEPLRAAGLEVSIAREGEVRGLPAGADLSAYRIVQEALTNTLRHAHASRADVTLRYESGMLDVIVVDDGRGAVAATSDGGGHGIVGMRERATMLGGTVETGSLPGGGFRVHARLPLEPAE